MVPVSEITEDSGGVLVVENRYTVGSSLYNYRYIKPVKAEQLFQTIINILNSRAPRQNHLTKSLEKTKRP